MIPRWKRESLQGLMPGLFLICLPLFSQGNLGRILGTVTDQTGAVIGGTTVTVLDVARGAPRILTTDEVGQYNAPNLTPGTYTVRAEFPGFKTAESANILGLGGATDTECSQQRVPKLRSSDIAAGLNHPRHRHAVASAKPV